MGSLANHMLTIVLMTCPMGTVANHMLTIVLMGMSESTLVFILRKSNKHIKQFVFVGASRFYLRGIRAENFKCGVGAKECNENFKMARVPSFGSFYL